MVVYIQYFFLMHYSFHLLLHIQALFQLPNAHDDGVSVMELHEDIEVSSSVSG